MKYRTVAAEEAMDFLLQSSAQDRRVLSDLLKQIGAAPFQLGNDTLLDETGRELQMLFVKKFVITFWADHAVKELRIVRVEKPRI